MSESPLLPARMLAPPAKIHGTDGSSCHPWDTDGQKLISTVETSFAELRQDANHQSNSLKSALERLTAAVEALKQQPQSSDPKTTFWTAHKTLAYEFDKELQRKYGNDLDTSLIFAGLFSAVTSAFIIQIQPEFQGDPNAVTETLLMILVLNITSAASPATQMLPQTQLSITVVIAQGLLYFSLFSTLLAALLAVLGKQWLLHYDSVGQKGTVDQRGLERQRKFDGLRRWKFHIIMQIFPLLLQFSLLLFATALSIYLWTIHRGIAGIVLGSTCLGLILYTLMVVSALVSPDSPFQTSLTTLLGVVVKLAPLPSLAVLTRAFFDPLHRLVSRIWSASWNVMKTIPPPLPQFALRKIPEATVTPQPTLVFPQIPQPSEQVSAVVWALETSTDPRLVEAAAELVLELQWPVNLDLRPSLRRLSDIFNGCFDGHTLRVGMGNRAASCIKAFGLLEMVTARHEGWSSLWTFDHLPVSGADRELDSMVTFFHFNSARRILILRKPITQWTLRFIAMQHTSESQLENVLTHFHPEKAAVGNVSLFADFLYCVNSFLAPPAARDLSLMDKSGYCVLLLTLLCKNLAKRLTEGSTWTSATAGRIVRRIIEFNPDLYDFRYRSGDYDRLRRAVYRFCASPGLEQSTVTGLLPFVRFRFREDSRLKLGVLRELQTLIIPLNLAENVNWVYSCLEQQYASTFRDVVVIRDLLQVLFTYSLLPSKPSPTALRAIVSTITSDVGDYDNSTHYLAFHVLTSADHWFQENELRTVLQEYSVWATLGAFDPDLPLFRRDITTHYISLGYKISTAPEWKTTIFQDLPSWLALLPTLQDPQINDKTIQEFCVVLSRIWAADVEQGQHLGYERPLAMSVIALANIWDGLDSVTITDIDSLIPIIKCTISTAFHGRVDNFWIHNVLSPRFQDIIMAHLGDSLARAGQKIKASTPSGQLDVIQDSKHTVYAVAELLVKLALTVNGELRNGAAHGRRAEEIEEITYWLKLRKGFYTDVEHLRQLFSKT